MKILISGVAGFIGFHVCQNLIQKGNQVIGIDNLNDYYDINLKKKRLSILRKLSSFDFYQIDINNYENCGNLFKSIKFDKVVHFAAQPGVQNSILNPEIYMQNNILGFFNILNLSTLHGIQHFIYASSSSVYGSNESFPFTESDKCASPLSLYAASKLSNEAIAYSYSNIHKIKTTGLRFFTVYGPYGRPDMSPFIFADAIINEKIIKLYNFGKLKRDFTYIDDAVKAVELIVTDKKKLQSDLVSKIYNIGGNGPIELSIFIKLFEKYLKKKAILKLEPLLRGDVVETYANIEMIKQDYGFQPGVSIEKGVRKFIDWYKRYNI